MSMMDIPAVQEWSEANPGWESWLALQDHLWERAIELRDQGYVLGQVLAILGLAPDTAEIEELKEQLERQAKEIKMQAAVIARGTAENEQQRQTIEALDTALRKAEPVK